MKTMFVTRIVQFILVIFLWSLAVTVFAEGTPNLQDLAKQQRELWKNGKYEEAINVIQRITENYPDSNEAKDARTLLPPCYEKLRQYEKAITAYRQLIENPPTDSFRISALRSIVHILRDTQKNPQAAIEECEGFIQKYPDEKYTEEIYLDLGDIYDHYLHNYEKAAEKYQIFVTKFPQSYKVEQGLGSLARAYQTSKNYEKAIETYLLLTERNPDSDAMFWIGDIYYHGLSQYDKAIDAYQKAATGKVETSAAAARRALLQLYTETGRTEEAQIEKAEIAKEADVSIAACREELKKPLDEFTWTRTMMKLSYLYRNEKKDFDTGLRILQEILEKYPKGQQSFEVEMSFITNCLMARQHQRALDECNKILANYPKEHPLVREALQYKVHIYTNLKDYKKAVEICQVILKDYPDSDLAKVAKIEMGLLNDYYMKGKTPSPEDAQKAWEKGGLKEGIISTPAPPSPSQPPPPSPPSSASPVR